MKLMIVNMLLVFWVVQITQTTVDETDDSEYAFGVLGGADNPDNGEISVKIGGVQVTMIIDSGASCNVLDRGRQLLL